MAQLRRWMGGVSRVMAVGLLVCGAGFAGPGMAQTLPSIPVNTKVGSLQVPLSCKFPLLGNQTVKLTMTGSVNNVLAPGQTFYLADASGTMEIPKTVVGLVSWLLRATTVSGTVSDMEINGTNVSPASLNAMGTPLAFGPIPLVRGQTALIPIPSSSFLQVGPFTAGSVGTAQLSLGSASATITLSGARGTIGKPLAVACAMPSPAVNLVSMTVAGSPTSAVAQPHTGLDSSDFNPPLNKQVGVLHYSVGCTVAGLIPQTADVTLTGTLSTAFTAGVPFFITNASGTMHLSADSVNLLLTLNPFTTSLGGSLSDMDIVASQTSQGTVNAAALANIAMAQTSVARNKDVTIPIPDTGTLTIGPFTPNSTATQTDVTIGGTTGVLQPMMSGLPAIPLPFSCSAPNPAVNLVSVTVSSASSSSSAVAKPRRR